ncbi:MAG TPA: GGDEF domain-containing protein [Pyrinomonadaceae bacterium]|jgi:diguanylate cyclase (GGDEF)-like protein|nr:GGDEF domain-containing protein [Pyrinomonadaceae bacterium]
MDSNVGLAIQCVGILLVTLLTLFMRGSIESKALKYWAAAWTCLAVSLMCLFTGFVTGRGHNYYYSFYFLGEYCFGLLFIAGCRYHALEAPISRAFGYLASLALLVAVVLPRLSADFNDLFVCQAAIMAALFAVSFAYMRVAGRRRNGSSPGARVTCVALLLLAVDFFHYAVVFSARKGAWGITVPSGYLKYTSICDLILEILLGFGTVMLLMEGVRREVEAANQKLLQARDRLELMAQMDPLTEALNRHAFHSLLNRNESAADTDVSGCVAVIDVDNLKVINDTLGHSVGDRAIRAVSHAVRSLIRADDMLFRWGGDEFLVMMFNLPDAEAERRMLTLNEVLARNAGDGTEPLGVRVSFGVAGFNSLTQIGGAIEKADKAMYQKREGKRRRTTIMQFV